MICDICKEDIPNNKIGVHFWTKHHIRYKEYIKNKQNTIESEVEEKKEEITEVPVVNVVKNEENLVTNPVINVKDIEKSIENTEKAVKVENTNTLWHKSESTTNVVESSRVFWHTTEDDASKPIVEWN